MNKKRARSAVVIYAIILIVGFLLINKWLGGSSNVATNYSYTEFSADLNAGNIAAVDITQNTNVCNPWIFFFFLKMIFKFLFE